MPHSPQSSRAAARARHYGPDDPRTLDARRDLAEHQITEYVRKIVDTAPPLTDAQRARIAALVLGAGTR